MPDEGSLKKALEPGALQKSVESIISTPPPDSGTQVDVAVVATEDGTGAEVKVTSAGSWWSLGAWAQWLEHKGWATAGFGSLKWGGKKER